MQQFKQTIRTIILYIVTVVLVGGVPMAAYADKSDACIAAGRKGVKWVTNPATGECVKASILPAESAAVSPSPSPETSSEPAPSESPAPELAPEPEASQSDASSTTTIGSTTDTNNTNTVGTGVDSTAVSGDATVKGNQSSGNAGTGNADAQATVINSVHSTVDGDTKGIAHFTADINGDVTGDITLGSTIDNAKVDSSLNVNGKTNINNDTALTNDVSLTALTGDAKVRGNESVGSATSGNANTVADILNLINTIIAANKSFVGTINIYGNLNGDILISPEFIPQLIASNAAASSTVNLPLSTNINDDNTIVNNVKLDATSGNASVQGNGSEGSATSGTAMTNLTILNLTGHEVNAANSLLVFVNVLGKWVGMIVDAPGATAAAIGSGVLDSTVNVSDQTTINNKAAITNNLDLTSRSGDASVAGNQSAGSATSGSATASANIANISTSTFNLTGWFGILYINVFGTWLGSFGVDTAAGTVTPLTGMAVPEPTATIAAPNLRFGFVPTYDDTSFGSSAAGIAAGNSSDGTYQAAVLASAIASGQQAGSSTQLLTPALSPREDPFSVIMMIAGFGVAGVSGTMWLARRIMEARGVRTLA